MSYHFFGNSHSKPVTQVIREANKQKKAEDIISAILSPINYAAKTGAKMVTGSTIKPVSEEQYIKALILKTLQENGLIPHSKFEKRVRSIVEEVLIKKRRHPLWQSILHR